MWKILLVYWKARLKLSLSSLFNQKHLKKHQLPKTAELAHNDKTRSLFRQPTVQWDK